MNFMSPNDKSQLINFGFVPDPQNQNSVFNKSWKGRELIIIFDHNNTNPTFDISIVRVPGDQPSTELRAKTIEEVKEYLIAIEAI